MVPWIKLYVRWKRLSQAINFMVDNLKYKKGEKQLLVNSTLF